MLPRAVVWAVLVAGALSTGACHSLTPLPPEDYEARMARPLLEGRPLKLNLLITSPIGGEDDTGMIGWFETWREQVLLPEIRRVAPGATFGRVPKSRDLVTLDLRVDLETVPVGWLIFGLMVGYHYLPCDRTVTLHLRDGDEILSRRVLELEELVEAFCPPLIWGGAVGVIVLVMGQHLPISGAGVRTEIDPVVGEQEAKLIAAAVQEMLAEHAPALQLQPEPEPQPQPQPQRQLPPGTVTAGGPAVAPAPQANVIRPVIAVASPADDLRTFEAGLRLVARAGHPSGVAKVTILLNGVPRPDDTRGIGGVAAATPKGGEVEVDVPIELALGENQLRLVATANDGQEAEVIRTVYRERSGTAGREKWAVVIGVSRYRNAAAGGITELKYAAGDARMFYEVLTTVGQVSPERALLLTDAEATSAAVREALFGFLARAAPDDLVIVYFAGHGAPEPANPKNLFLLTHDTDPKKLAATAFPMWDIETALERAIRAERVVVLADACHAGGVAGGAGMRGAQDNLINRYLARLEEAGAGRAVFTASESGELSQEDARWGGGHGVFTWYLCEGLRGQADTNGDWLVTLGELLDYTDTSVRRDTGSKQHPTRAGRFDRRLPLAVVHPEED